MTNTLLDSRKTTACPGCGAPVPWPDKVWQLLKGKPPAVLCPECGAEKNAADRERQNAEIRRLREAAWCELCPALYQLTDPARLPQEQLAEVLAWEPGPEGLLLIGPTGGGKTRAAWLLLRKLVHAGEKVIAFDALDFGHECGKQFGNGGDTGKAWAARMAKVPIVFLDDLGKAKFTSRVESELFGLVERRMAGLLPIIATTNLTGAALKEQMTNDRGAPLVRRLREFCRTVVFT